ncbi:lysylphosphatidylglycerol synthase transmembrane domain-containing protein [Roseburia sp. MSJ-14]|uniref:lysylphosphatidylglycerol synthase transmembrane domain-containing protein n=1 Tax=Roseburia sp. MSJ-14 TaxID=2841514 RepID=UPI001C104373|nr:flippase-like domain-containing protein [Roseburia sp. MSJ-14]
MESKKKKIGNALFLVVVFLLTIYSVFHGEDLQAVGKAIEGVNLWYIIPAGAAVIFFVWGESIIIHYMFGTLDIKTKERTCFLYSCVGFFFSAITPSATGGQPAQIYYMRKNKIPIPVATLVLMIVTITYKSILVIIGLFVAFFQRGFVHHYLEGILPIFYLGVGLNVFCCIFMSFLVFWPNLAKNMLVKGMHFLEHIHLMKKKPERQEKLEASMEHYEAAAVYFKTHKKVIGNVMIITFVQRFALFFVTWFVYKAFGLSGTSIYDVVMLQAVVSVSVDMLPLPGGMGISENLFLIIFKGVFAGSLLLPGMVLSRGIAYYVQLLFSAVMTAVAHFRIGYSQTE